MKINQRNIKKSNRNAKIILKLIRPTSIISDKTLKIEKKSNENMKISSSQLEILIKSKFNSKMLKNHFKM